MQTRTAFSHCLLVAGGLLGGSCGERAAEPTPLPAVPTQGITPANVTYDNYVGLLLTTRCKTCHNPASALSTKPALSAWVNQKTYANARDNGVKIVASIGDDQMPVARPLPATEKELLYAWLKRGMPQN